MPTVAHVVDATGHHLCRQSLFGRLPHRWVDADQRVRRCQRCTRLAANAVQVVRDDTGLTYRRLDEIAVAARMVELTDAGLTVTAAHHAARHRGLLPGGRLRVVRAASSPGPVPDQRPDRTGATA